ncbi:hypothetical protein BANRA_05308 [Klebsiella pneumoniae]|nr:hypothetical protein BANRA_05308 [Klebsiella pneumoniae]
MLLQRSFINREPTLSGDGLQGCGECDRRRNFNDEQYAEFIDMLDAPVEDEPAINKLLARKPQWDV